MPDGDEPDASGARGLSRRETAGRNRVIGAALDLKLPEIAAASSAISKLDTSLGKLQKTLQGFKPSDAKGMQDALTAITKAATGANAAVAGVGSGTSGAGSSSTAWVQQANQQASSASSSSAGSWAQRMPAGIKDASRYFTGFENPAVGAAMGGLRFLRERLGTNRNTAIAAGAQWGGIARQQGVKVENMMSQVSQFPGDIYGTPEDMLNLYGNAPMYGASYNFGGQQGGQGVRAAGMLKGISQAQMMNPGESVSQIMGNIGGFAANTRSQQQSAYLTGGAYSMIAGGGRQKSISEWAEGVLQWLKGLRAGDMRNKDFTYGELMAQYFPGSNIDAWFDANGVPPNMRSYWWTYVLEKANKSPGKTTIGGEMQIRPDESNVAWNRMRATSELTRTEFNLGAQMSGAYNQRERSNKWLNQLMGTLQTNMAPAFTLLAALPDTIEDILMGLLESFMGSKFGTPGAASAANNVGAVEPTGDIGDTGMYGMTGGTGLAGLSPNMRSKLGPMLAANPRLKVTSGLRDNAMQRRLKDKGYSRVSGKPSSHTRGDAADLGPSSEYGWIMANAKKFGLKSGKNQGEPWHVGVGDIPSGYDLFSQIMSGAGTSGGMMDIIGSVLGSIFGGLGGLLGGGGGGGTEVPSTDWFNEMMPKGSEGFGSKLGGLSSLLGGSTGGGGVGAGGGGGSGGAAGFGTSTNPASNRARAVATARIASKYWHGADLEKMVAIAGRESSWMPWAHRSDQPKSQLKGDRGLYQINRVNDETLMSAGIFSERSQLFDPEINIRSAYELYKRAGNSFFPWNMSSGGWSQHGDPLYGTNIAEARAAVAEAGVGDMDEMRYQAMIPMASMGRSSNMQFHNTFLIQAGGPSAQNGIDVRRTITLVADGLEGEMNKRLARVN